MQRWPPKDWEQLDEDRRFQAAFLVMIDLEKRIYGQNVSVTADPHPLIAKYNFLLLPGSRLPPMPKDPADAELVNTRAHMYRLVAQLALAGRLAGSEVAANLKLMYHPEKTAWVVKLFQEAKIPVLFKEK